MAHIRAPGSAEKKLWIGELCETAGSDGIIKNAKWKMKKNETVEEGLKPYNVRHRCFQFAKDVMVFVNECRYQRIHFSVFDQLIRSATSIGANVVEGGSGSTKKDFINFFYVALKSANETKYWLCLIRDTMEVNRYKMDGLLKEADEISKIIAAIILSAK
jgi:four helix bundle protein